MRAFHPRAAHIRPAYARDTTFVKTVLLALLLALITAVLMAPPNTADAQDATPQTGNNCAAGEAIDGSTAEQAKAKLEAAGYTNITGLEKGCDNVWHAQAQSSGNAINVMVAPDGAVNQETN
jgi:flagellar basal body rod protein FlgG